MTACVIVIANNCIEAFSDGAAFDEEGYMGEYGSKIQIVSHCNALIFCRGSGFSSALAKMMLSRLATFDEMILQLTDAVQMASLLGHEKTGEAINLSVVIAGYSEKHKEWQAHSDFNCVEDGKFREGVLTPRRLPWWHAEPSPSEEALQKSILFQDGEIKWPGTIEGGIALLEAQRATQYRFGPDIVETGCIVGAFVERTLVSLDGCFQQIVHRWPDRIGKKLNSCEEELRHAS